MGHPGCSSSCVGKPFNHKGNEGARRDRRDRAEIEKHSKPFDADRGKAKNYYGGAETRRTSARKLTILGVISYLIRREE